VASWYKDNDVFERALVSVNRIQNRRWASSKLSCWVTTEHLWGRVMSVLVFVALFLAAVLVGASFLRQDSVYQKPRSAIPAILRKAKGMPANDNKRVSRRNVTGAN
jgi:hypothetical protein